MKKLILLALITLLTAGIFADEIKLKYSSITGDDVPMVREYMEFFREALREGLQQTLKEYNVKSTNKGEKQIDFVQELSIEKLKRILYIDTYMRYLYPEFTTEFFEINTRPQNIIDIGLYTIEEIKNFSLESKINESHQYQNISLIRAMLWKRMRSFNSDLTSLFPDSSLNRYVKAKVTNKIVYHRRKGYATPLNRLIVAEIIITKAPFNTMIGKKMKIRISGINKKPMLTVGKEYIFRYGFYWGRHPGNYQPFEVDLNFDEISYFSTSGNLVFENEIDATTNISNSKEKCEIEKDLSFWDSLVDNIAKLEGDK